MRVQKAATALSLSPFTLSRTLRRVPAPLRPKAPTARMAGDPLKPVLEFIGSSEAGEEWRSVVKSRYGYRRVAL